MIPRPPIYRGRGNKIVYLFFLGNNILLSQPGGIAIRRVCYLVGWFVRVFIYS